ncbi:MAG: glycosyltransferase, partial [Gammaproteobacteria bacterium]|nr:glycosyltransferase [Gammaproteobacteria bacterium]
MKNWIVEFAGQTVAIQYSNSRVAELLDFLFGDVSSTTNKNPVETFCVETDKAWRNCVLSWSDNHDIQINSRSDLAVHLFSEVLFTLINRCDTGHVFHAAAVHKDGKGILIPGKSGSGKTTLCAWLVAQGYSYLTDEAVYFPIGQSSFCSFTRPLNFKSGSAAALDSLLDASFAENGFATESDINIVPHRLINDSWQANSAEASFLLFPEFTDGAELSIEPLSPAQSSMALMSVHANARNLEYHGFHEAISIARSTPAFRLFYSDFGQIENQLDLLLELVLEKTADAKYIAKLFRAMRSVSVKTVTPNPVTTKAVDDIPEETKQGSKKKLTIGMATYDDYDGVYFSVQAIRMFHPEVADDTEILVIDNNPTGPCAEALKKLDKWVKNYRYVPNTRVQGTAIRDLVFEEANADSVLCIDSHVLLVRGSIRKLLDYYEKHPDCMDLLQGPMLYDDQQSIVTH